MKKELIIKKIESLLSSNEMHYDFSVDDNGFIKIIIDDGDWKHDHLALKIVMKEAGFNFVDRHIPDEEEDDDCFSAVYLYTIKE